jgi:hypothetical protein
VLPDIYLAAAKMIVPPLKYFTELAARKYICQIFSLMTHIYQHGTTIENWQTLQAKINQHPNAVSTSPYIQEQSLKCQLLSTWKFF